MSCAVCGKANYFKQVCRNAGKRVAKDAVLEKGREVHDTCQDAEK